MNKVMCICCNPAIDESIFLDDFALGDVNRAERSERHAGGKGINVARILADYGNTVAVSGFLGTENNAIFKKCFAEAGIEDQFVYIQGYTRVGLKIIDKSQRTITEINFPGLEPDEAKINALLRVIQEENYQTVVLSGSLPKHCPPTLYTNIINSVQQADPCVIVDTSGTALTLSIEAVPSVIKPNIHELSEYVGRRLETDKDVLAVSRDLVHRGIPLVVVSMGERGAMFVNAYEAVRAFAPHRVTLASTVGAGDALVAGIAVSLDEGLSLKDTARKATGFANYSVQHIELGIHSKQELAEEIGKLALEEY